MRRRGRFLVLCLLLVLLPLRGLLAAMHLGCEQAPLQREHIAHAHHNGHGEARGAAAKPCKLCTPCCLTAAPPPVLTTGTTSTTAAAPAEAWASVVPPPPDPPPRP